jgi:hypothetical protein
VVDAAKVREYLLSTTHPDGRSKATFFIDLGYSPLAWARLSDDLLGLATRGEVHLGRYGPHGQAYLVRGRLQGPVKTAEVITVWIVLEGEDRPRLVTAYPGRVS